jgi:hypothetical protein
VTSTNQSETLPVIAAKAGVLLLWLLCLTGVGAAPESTLWRLGRLAVWLALGIHSVEYLVLYRYFGRAKGSRLRHFGQVMVFGLIHVWSLERSPTRLPA